MPHIDWLFVLPQVPSGPARHRVAVWRELRKSGAVPVSPGMWAVPDTPALTASLERTATLASNGGGTVAVFQVSARDEAAASVLRDAFVAARRDEWAEFERDCGKFEVEIASEVAKTKFTFGELEEEEQSLDRLRRWYRELRRRDLLQLPEATSAEHRLRHCEDVLGGFADRVYEAMHAANRGDLPREAGRSDDHDRDAAAEMPSSRSAV